MYWQKIFEYIEKLFKIDLKICVLSRNHLSQSKIFLRFCVLLNAEKVLVQLNICLRFVIRFVSRFVYCQESIWANQILNWKLSILHQRQLASIVELYVPHIYNIHSHIYSINTTYIWPPLFCGTTYILYIWRYMFHTHCSSRYYVPRYVLCSLHIFELPCIYLNSSLPILRHLHSFVKFSLHIILHDWLKCFRCISWAWVSESMMTRKSFCRVSSVFYVAPFPFSLLERNGAFPFPTGHLSSQPNPVFTYHPPLPSLFEALPVFHFAPFHC